MSSALWLATGFWLFVSTPPDTRGKPNVHALRVKLMTTGQTHNPTDAVDILLQAHNTLYLSPHVFLPLARRAFLMFRP